MYSIQETGINPARSSQGQEKKTTIWNHQTAKIKVQSKSSPFILFPCVSFKCAPLFFYINFLYYISLVKRQ